MPTPRGCALVFGWLAVAVSVPLILLGLLALPAGGLMFALPYMLLAPGIALALGGAVLVWCGGRRL